MERIYHTAMLFCKPFSLLILLFLLILFFNVLYNNSKEIIVGEIIFIDYMTPKFQNLTVDRWRAIGGKKYIKFKNIQNNEIEGCFVPSHIKMEIGSKVLLLKEGFNHRLIKVKNKL